MVPNHSTTMYGGQTTTQATNKKFSCIAYHAPMIEKYFLDPWTSTKEFLNNQEIFLKQTCILGHKLETNIFKGY